MIENPFRLIRRRLRLAQTSVKGLSKTTVQRIENGQYEELSEGMLEAIIDAVEGRGVPFPEVSAMLEAQYGTPYLTEAYGRWRTYQRTTFGEQATWPDLDRLPTDRSPMHGFIELLSGSLHKFCAALCLQGPTVERYARGEYSYLEPPLSLLEAFIEAGYTERETLFELQRKWIDGR